MRVENVGKPDIFENAYFKVVADLMKSIYLSEGYEFTRTIETESEWRTIIDLARMLYEGRVAKADLFRSLNSEYEKTGNATKRHAESECAPMISSLFADWTRRIAE